MALLRFFLFIIALLLDVQGVPSIGTHFRLFWLSYQKNLICNFNPNGRPVYIYWESVLFPGTIINETTFPNFQINIFYYSSYKITWQVDYIYIYVCYLQLVSFQTKKIWENETYFHYLSERLQLLHLRGNPCLQQVEKFYLLFSSRTCLGLRPELHL